MVKLKHVKGAWIYIVPVSNLILTPDVKNEYRVRDVTFISAKKLPYVRRRFGMPCKISDFKKRNVTDDFFSEADTFAILRMSGKQVDIDKVALKKIREELEILSLSQLGYAKRRVISFPSISNEVVSGRRDYLVLSSEKMDTVRKMDRVGKIGDLVLDGRWNKFQKNVFFHELVKIIREENKNVSSKWSKDIRRASLLIGQSQCSSDIPQAFLWNMIALELLLTKQGDSYLDTLPKRVEAFIGWTQNWDEDGYEVEIKKIYKKRSKLVHNGEKDKIMLKDLLFTDDLLFNILANIVTHTNIFKSKDDLITFSEKIQAEKFLEIPSSVQPKTFKYLSRRYTEKDYDEKHFL